MLSSPSIFQLNFCKTHLPVEVRKDTGLFTSHQVQKPQKGSMSPSRTYRPSNLRRRLDKKPRGSYIQMKSEWQMEEVHTANRPSLWVQRTSLGQR